MQPNVVVGLPRLLALRLSDLSTEAGDTTVGKVRAESRPSGSTPSQSGGIVSDGGEDGWSRRSVKPTNGPDVTSSLHNTFRDVQVNKLMMELIVKS